MKDQSWKYEFEKKFGKYIADRIMPEKAEANNLLKGLIKTFIQSLLDKQEANYKEMVEEMIGIDMRITNMMTEKQQIIRFGYGTKRQEIINIAKKYGLEGKEK
jgi:hypothetical protein